MPDPDDASSRSESAHDPRVELSVPGGTVTGMGTEGGDLAGRVALVAGATRGAGRGIATRLGAAGATVYVSGRSGGGQRSEYDRAETIEETAELVTAAGGRGIPVRADRLEVLVNDIWGGELLVEWDTPVWEHSLDGGLRMVRLAIETHLVTNHF